MKIFIPPLLFLLFANSTTGQIFTSNCDPSQELINNYTWDMKNLTLRRLWELNSPDTALVTIPQQWQDTIMSGLAAICNATIIPERDSVYNLYCVHDLVSTSLTITKETMVFVDTSYSWTDAWQNLVTLTGNPQIDTIVTRYDLEITEFNNFSFGSMALLATDSLWNVYALIDSIAVIPGVLWCEPNHLIGTAGRIVYDKIEDERYYTFWFQWNDCFDGCDNSHGWKFRVFDDCSVEYLGFENWGVFEILPLPEPVNCNLFSGQPDKKPYPGIQFYPNPVDDQMMIVSKTVENYHVVLYNCYGKILSETEVYLSAAIDFSDLPPGLYMISLKNFSGQEVIYKVVKK